MKDIDVKANSFMKYLSKYRKGALVEFEVLDNTKSFIKGSKVPLSGVDKVYGILSGEHELITYSYGVVDHYDDTAVRPVRAWVCGNTRISDMLQPVDILALSVRDYSTPFVEGIPLYATVGKVRSSNATLYAEEGSGSWSLMGPDGLLVKTGEWVSLFEAYQLGQKFFYPPFDTLSPEQTMTLTDYISIESQQVFSDSLKSALLGLDGNFDMLGI